MSVGRISPVSSLLCLCLVSGCVASQGTGMAMSALGAVAGGGGGVNPISAVVGMAGMAAANSIGMAQSAVISPQETAKYAGMSCPELRQLTANYAMAQSAGPAPKKYGALAPAGKMAIATQIITTRLAALKQISASKGC